MANPSKKQYPKRIVLPLTQESYIRLKFDAEFEGISVVEKIRKLIDREQQ